MNNAAFVLLAAACGLASTPVAAAEVAIPHTFSSGTPARASEVNENFSALKEGVDSNAAAIEQLQAEIQVLTLAMRNALQVQVNGETVGTLFGMDEEKNLIALTDQGYFVDLNPVNVDETVGGASAMKMIDVDFGAPDCQGSMYISGIAMFSGRNIYFRQGIVFGSPGPGGSTVARVAKGDPSQVTVYSTQYPGDDGTWICQNFDPPGGYASDAIALTANDPELTGVPNNLTGPVRVAR